MAVDYSIKSSYLITGANRGLGKGLVQEFLLRPNSTVIAAVRDPASSSSKALYDLPRGQGSNLILVKIDSSIDTDAAAAVAQLAYRHNITALNVVIASAGISNVWPAVHKANPDDMRTHFNINVVGVATLFQAVRPLLLSAAGANDGNDETAPKFITLGSTAGWLTSMEQIPFGNAAYGPSKAALHWISKKIHLENPEIVAFPLHPGWVQTEMGNAGAVAFGFDEAQISVKESIDGMVNVIDNATRDKSGGRFLVWDGTESTW